MQAIRQDSIAKYVLVTRWRRLAVWRLLHAVRYPEQAAPITQRRCQPTHTEMPDVVRAAGARLAR